MFGTENSIEPASLAHRMTSRKQPRQEPETDAVAERHNLYIDDKWRSRVYYADYQQKTEVMRANAKHVTTKHEDTRTVSAMLDLAQERGWQTIKLRGSESFKREAWVQAQVRGIVAEGYKPKQTDVQEVQRRKATVTPISVGASKPKKAEAQQAAREFWTTQQANQTNQPQPKQQRGMRM